MLIDKLKSSENPIIQRFARGEADESLRLKAAGGVLPLESADQLRIFFMLRKDPSREVRVTLKKTFDGFSDDDLRAMLDDDSLEAEVLHFVSLVITNREKPMEVLLTHPNVADKTIAVLAKKISTRLIELVLVNQDRLIRYSTIIDNLLENENRTPSIEMKLVEIIRRHIEKVDPDSLLPESEEESEPESVGKDTTSVTENKKEKTVSVVAKKQQAGGAEEEERLNTFQKISRMNVAQKIVRAFKGNKEERGLLIRDSNKVVALTVLQCPKVQASEAEHYALLKNVPQEVLGAIARNRDWMKSYQVTLNLIKNPRAPYGVVQANLMRLKTMDLEHLKKDKNVSEAVRRIARQEHQKRTQKQK